MPRLRRVSPGEDAGISRLRSGEGFRYRRTDGGAVGAGDIDRIRALVIPPAWEDVWICADPRGHIQAVGTDAAGRRQYLYHPDWSAPRDRGKFARALALAEALPRARARVTTTLRRDDDSRERALAVAFRLLDAGAIRIGSRRYLARGGSRGLTTLQRRDATIEGSVVRLRFPAKSGVRADISIDDAELARVLAPMVAGRQSSPLLSFPQGRGRMSLTAADVNAYVRALTGGAFTAKDFRTLRGTIAAAQSLAVSGTRRGRSERKKAEREAVRACAAVLSNTPAVARASYIDPRLWRAYARGRLLDRSVSPESALRALLAG
ncbi:DNA topoisomerase IB [Microbacterium sp. SORGH_AS_0888]|uniref:DNA topoisomerase IB n=1 Tax=Microbacterium sp. SORGH_AS_0888 TaxID=3041791 RepID=UPI00277E319F|nr:DNA topoisomerase IB [Microbacterium sp. SORGH_AS_0888]MDQ1130141.1 DNA topoisomerase-1 [Microbacterium sp. SORGH_AS_0888]